MEQWRSRRLALFAWLLLSCIAVDGFNISIPEEELTRLLGTDSSLSPLPNDGQMVTMGEVNVRFNNAVMGILRSHTLDGGLMWQYDVSQQGDVEVRVSSEVLPGSAAVLVTAKPSNTTLARGKSNASLAVKCQERAEGPSQIKLQIHYQLAGVERALTYIISQNCSNFQPTTAPRLPPTTTAPTTTAGAANTSSDSGGNVGGTEPPSAPASSDSPMIAIISGLAGLVIVIVVIVTLLELYGRRKLRGRKRNPPPKQSMFDEVLVDYNDLELGRELGKGAFGVVREGLLRGGKIAVKIIKEADNEDRVVKFLEEALYMKKFHHPNVLSLIGVCFQPNEAPMILVPFMANGDLHTYLNDHNQTVSPASEPLDYLQLLNFSIQVTNAMEYLASLNFVHRDLAARNCLLSADLVVKVADFGLARDMQEDMYYRMNSEHRMPVKWTALESIKHQRFTLESDVWAYGVLLWEIMSTGMLPYPGIANADLVAHLEAGHRLQQPARCPDAVYLVMLSCWEDDPKKRPHFSQIKRMLREGNQQMYENIMAMPIYRDTSTLERSAHNSLSDRFVAVPPSATVSSHGGGDSVNNSSGGGANHSNGSSRIMNASSLHSAIVPKSRDADEERYVPPNALETSFDAAAKCDGGATCQSPALAATSGATCQPPALAANSGATCKPPALAANSGASGRISGYEVPDPFVEPNAASPRYATYPALRSGTTTADEVEL